MTQDEEEYDFCEADFPRLSLNDIEDMYLAKVQGRMRHFSTTIQREYIKSLLIFIRSIVIQERVEDIQLAVESYKKRVNFTKPQLDLPDINRLPQYTLIKKPFRVVYRSERHHNCFMACKELHKFGDHTLKKVRDGLAYRLKEIHDGIGSPKRWNSREKRDVKKIITRIDERLFRRDQIRKHTFAISPFYGFRNHRREILHDLLRYPNPLLYSICMVLETIDAKYFMIF